MNDERVKALKARLLYGTSDEYEDGDGKPWYMEDLDDVRDERFRAQEGIELSFGDLWSDIEMGCRNTYVAIDMMVETIAFLLQHPHQSTAGACNDVNKMSPYDYFEEYTPVKPMTMPEYEALLRHTKDVVNRALKYGEMHGRWSVKYGDPVDIRKDSPAFDAYVQAVTQAQDEDELESMRKDAERNAKDPHSQKVTP